MPPILRAICTALLFGAFGLPALAAPVRVPLQINSYDITADLDPATNKLTATAVVGFTALDDLPSASFEFNSGLQITSLTDAQHHPLQSDRPAASTLRVTPAALVTKGTTTTWTFAYTGTLKGSDTSPVEGLKLASVEDPISILLYPGRWFPMVGLFTDRFTAQMHIRVPSDERVVGSGSGVAAVKSLPGNRSEYTFNWAKPGFPGTIIAGRFADPISAPGAPNITIYATEKHKADAPAFAQTAVKQFEFMATTFGQPESSRLTLVELPDDSISAAWAPEIAAIAGRRISDHSSNRLLANTIAHQWWGSLVSPATLNDAWITNGMSRYGELLYLEDSAGKSAFQTAVSDISAGALAYDTEPLSTMGRLDPFSPQFQSMTLEKGAMIFHMLRWEMGDDVFFKFLRTLLARDADKGIRSADVEKTANTEANLQLTPFFAQWVDGTGAPAFNDKYTVYRLGNNKGFRTTGSIDQDLDLFRMPVELQIDTDGKTENRRVDVSGQDSPYSVDTFGRPRKITIDPNNWLLKSTPDLAVKVAVLRGQQQVAQGDLVAALGEYQKALDANRTSSLAAYRIGEVFFTQRNYQSAANSFRDALRGDGDPRWTEVWSHIELGRIFDVTGQRDRAVNEYRLAVQTNDNTQGAVNEARALMQKPYKRIEAE